MENTIDAIVELEWRMFDTTQNEGGRAPCQEDRRTFEIMRRSHLLAWSEQLASGWLSDLAAAEAAGRNLMAEKYAYMMRYTAPEAYAGIEALLPAVSAEKLACAEEIVQMNAAWNEVLAAKYPHIMARGRPLRSTQDSSWQTSSETYLRCELWTYSESTLRIMLDDLRQLHAQGENYVEAILENMVRLYGFPGLEAAEEIISAE